MGVRIRLRRNFLHKVILAIPLLWFSVIGFIVVMTGDKPGVINQPDLVDRHIREGRENTVMFKSSRGPAAVMDQPVIERPNNDRIRLLERMREDAANELRLKEELLHRNRSQQMMENAMRPRVPMNPFHDHVIQERAGQLGSPHPQVDVNAPGKFC